MSDTHPGSIRDIGSPAYIEALRREAAFWEGAASGAVDLSVAPWRDGALSNATSGDLLDRALTLAVARGPRVLELACGGGGISMRLAQRGCDCDGVDLSAGLIALGRRTAEALSRRPDHQHLSRRRCRLFLVFPPDLHRCFDQL